MKEAAIREIENIKKDPYIDRIPTTKMRFNPSLIKTNEDAKKMLKGLKGLDDLEKVTDRHQKLSFVNVIRYILFLYSEDTILNVRPPRELDERQYRAAHLAGIEHNRMGQFSKGVVRRLFELHWEEIFNVVFYFLQGQKKDLWAEICVLEKQMQESQLLRLRPVKETSGKDDMATFDKKNNMTKYYREWRKILKEYYDEFYGDNDNVRNHKKLQVATFGLEARAY